MDRSRTAYTIHLNNAIGIAVDDEVCIQHVRVVTIIRSTQTIIRANDVVGPSVRLEIA